MAIQLQELIEKPKLRTPEKNPQLSKISDPDLQLWGHFQNKFVLQPQLSRKIVSFQANKTRDGYRWYKFKEAFSASLVEFLFYHYKIRKTQSAKILDPFAGSGTALFTASEMGFDADGIELLPIGHQIISARLILERKFKAKDFEVLKHWMGKRPWEKSKLKVTLPFLRITDGAYPPQTVDAIECFMGLLPHENENVRSVLRFALLCILESISYTRKDGQYLRWDYRSGRRQGTKPFDKGKILDFKQAMCSKLKEIITDIQAPQKNGELFPKQNFKSNIRLMEGSCLAVMPTLPDNVYHTVITSPPYCNRYDYTRTYALELALLGVDEQGLLNLRQQMLSCTVENRVKDLLSINPAWERAIEVVDKQDLIQSILTYLEKQKEQGELNNNGIPRMARGYFYEMACVLAECARVMKPNALMFMVNDNVRYAGASISVDMILSHIAEKLGFFVESILVLPMGKGNSSQQMGEHGRDPLRKCVYVWRKL